MYIDGKFWDFVLSAVGVGAAIGKVERTHDSLSILPL
jgi:hypothetical protein